MGAQHTPLREVPSGTPCESCGAELWSDGDHRAGCGSHSLRSQIDTILRDTITAEIGLIDGERVTYPSGFYEAADAILALPALASAPALLKAGRELADAADEFEASVAAGDSNNNRLLAAIDAFRASSSLAEGEG